MGAAISLPLAIAIPLAGGIAGSIGTSKAVKGWYKTLRKPKWTPPGWAFPVVWTTLYALMGTASWLVWRAGGFAAHPLALSLYGVQLVLNFGWTPLFFGLKKIDIALADISSLMLAVLATTASFQPISPVATGLMCPYVAWVGLATALNYEIYKNNPVGESNEEAKTA
mmetsp:Transcript_32726/g.92832  ORF Transcript_32726/g.92832 Transcript_32726/m.92832 type:complete len:168 (-) Transcript_32726:194-697(-)